MPPVHPYHLREVKEQCLAAVDKHSAADHLVINITGGTKLMAMAAYLSGLESKQPIIYVESRDRQLIAMSDVGSTMERFDETRFKQIGVKKYLTAYGRVIQKETLPCDLAAQDVSTAHFFVEHLRSSRPLLKKIIDAVYEFGDPSAPRRFSLSLGSADQQVVLDHLVQSGYLKQTPEPEHLAVTTEEAWHFLKGTWLEVYAFDALHQSGYFDDVRCNVMLRDAPGDLDVVLTRNASMAICEAKVGAKMSIVMRSLRALKESLAGVYGRTFYITARAQAGKDLRESARLYGISAIIAGPDLPRIAEVIQRHM
jgi:hypothetical protein